MIVFYYITNRPKTWLKIANILLVFLLLGFRNLGVASSGWCRPGAPT